MKARVRWSDQVEAYVSARAPDTRKALRSAIKGLAKWDGRADPPRIRFLEDDLVGYARLRVGAHRVVFREGFHERERQILCVFAGPRSTVYETFAEVMLDELSTFGG